MLVRQLSRAPNESIYSFAIRVTSCTISSIPPEEQDVQLQLKSFHLQMLSSFLNGMHNKTLHREVLKSSAQTIDQALLVINQVVASEKSVLLDHDLSSSKDKERTLASEVQLSDPKKSRFLTINHVMDEENENIMGTHEDEGWATSTPVKCYSRPPAPRSSGTTSSYSSPRAPLKVASIPDAKGKTTTTNFMLQLPRIGAFRKGLYF
jgi:hypothetical protein